MEAGAALKEPGGHPAISEPADIVKGVRVKVHLTHYCSPTSLFLRSAMADAEGQDDFHISPRNNHVDDAVIGMSCLVCHDSNRTLALRAIVTDVHRNPSGAALNVDVLYVDSGRTDSVGLDFVYTIDAESAAEPQRAITCCIRSVEPTAASSSFDLKQLLKRGAVFEAVFYTASDAGVYDVDLYAMCHDQKSGLKTYDVGRYLVQNGFAKLVDCLADTPEQVGSSAQSGVSVSHNSGEGTRFYATQGFCGQEGRCNCSHGLRSPAPLSEPIIDPMKQLRPPEVGSYVFGQVSAVLSPSCFYLVFPYGRRSVERLSTQGRGVNSQMPLETLIRELQATCNKGSFQENRHVARAQGELVAAKSNLDGRWYRARVVSLEEGDTLEVLYIDFGFNESLPVDQVRSLEARFALLPQQALQACLVTDKHENRFGEKPTWDAHSCEAFANFVSGKDLVVKIVCVAHGMLHVRLFYTDGQRLCSVWRWLRKACKANSN